MLYFSVTFMVATRSRRSRCPISATSSSIAMDFASFFGGRQRDRNGPEQTVLARHLVVSQHPSSLSLPMKPSSGVNAPMPIMIRSPVSRLVSGTFFMVCARLISAALASPSKRRGFSSELPCGGTSLLISSPKDYEVPFMSGCLRADAAWGIST